MSETLSTRVLAGFARAFDGVPDFVARAPGRVNLIGEHTDYNMGFALPAAIGRETRIAVRRREDRRVRVAALDFNCERDEFDLAADLLRIGGWRDYVRGIAATLCVKGHRLCGVDMVIAGNLPMGAGLSSSASLEVAAALALMNASGLPCDPVGLALIAQSAENDFVGVRCGNLDQLASAASIAGAALLIDCRSLELRPVPLPPNSVILIAQSGVSRGLVDSQYNQRREQCETAARILGVAALRDADAAMLEQVRDRMSELTYRRARHVISENARTQAAAAAFAAGDLCAVGKLMAESHVSMQRDFEITVPQTDLIVDLLHHELGEGCGARQTGGGFGGAVVAILSGSDVARASRAIERSYRTPDGKQPLLLVERASHGATFV